MAFVSMYSAEIYYFFINNIKNSLQRAAHAYVSGSCLIHILLILTVFCRFF